MSAIATADAPVRARGVELLGELPGSGYRVPPALARRGDGQTIQLTRLLYLVLRAMDGTRGYDEIAARVSAEYGRLVSADNVHALVERKLRPLGLLRQADGAEPRVRKANPLLGLRFRIVVSDPRRTRRITAPFARLFHPLLVAAVLLAFVGVSYWVLFDKGLASATYEAFQRPGLLLAVFAITVVSAGFHEFGHAAAAQRGGATPGAMGAGLYLVWPAFYTDVTDSYRLGRGGRLRTDLGGLYFNAVLAVAMFLAWWATGWDALLLIIAAQLLQMVRQLPPLVRYDGYHVLADLTGVPDLYHRIGPTLRGLLPHRWRDPEARVLRPWARAVVTAWVLLVVPLLLVCAVLLVVALPRILATGWAGIGREWAALHGHATDGDLAGILVRGLAIVAITLPLLGIGYLLWRLGRTLARGTWRATAGRPSRRIAAGIGMAAVVAWLAWMWWPDADTYRPIQPGEQGTVLDALPAAGTPTAAPRAAPAPTALDEGARGTARTVWPATGARPTADRPTLALLLIPRPPADASAPTWVFPFDPPPAPRAEDNQALAVNTTDGSTVYEVAFALVWVTDGTVDHRNEAYAVASCRDCATVAVAFQVVLVVGQADVVVPRNTAVAVNYACVECVTVALARQLVITVPEDLSAQARAELTRLWERIAEFARHIEGLSLQQIQDQLHQFESAILDIVRRETDPAPARPIGPLPGTSTTRPEPASPPAIPSTDPTTTPNPAPTTSTGAPPPSQQPTTTQPPPTSTPQP